MYSTDKQNTVIITTLVVSNQFKNSRDLWVELFIEQTFLILLIQFIFLHKYSASVVDTVGAAQAF